MFRQRGTYVDDDGRISAYIEYELFVTSVCVYGVLTIHTYRMYQFYDGHSAIVEILIIRMLLCFQGLQARFIYVFGCYTLSVSGTISTCLMVIQHLHKS